MMKRAGALCAAALFALAGCAGEDGSPGVPGQDGTSCSVQDNGNGTSTVTCTDGTVATVANGADGVNGVSCTLTTNSDGTRTVTCPDGTIILPAAPAVAGKVAVSNVALATDGADVVITYNVKLNGANTDLFTNEVEGYRSAGATSAQTIRTSIAGTAFTVAANGSGNYTLRVPGLATTIGTTPTKLMFNVNTGAEEPVATLVVDANGAPKSTVSDQACINCHGASVFREGHHDSNPVGAGACVVCHVRADRAESRLGTAATITNGAITAAGTAPGTRLMGYVHGIHNSHNMPAGSITANLDPDGAGPLPAQPYTVAKPAEVYARNGSLRLVDGVAQISSPFSVGFPSYMNNCSICHDTDANLALVMAKPVSYSTCMSCHDNWDGFAAEPAGHAAYNAATNCGACHGSGVASTGTVGDFHNGLTTGRGGLLWGGKDISVEEAKNIAIEITGITRDDSVTPSRLAIAWIAKNPTTGAAYDPCNTDYAVGPTFFGVTGSNLSVLRAYAQGNDWVNAGIGTSPGQPGSSVNVIADADPAVFANGETTCAANVATTVVNVETTTATKGVVAFQGRPRILFTAADPDVQVAVRTPAATREFMVADGSLPTNLRRAIVDSQKCLDCHRGSLYQHSSTGGTRVDNVDLCVVCHNPAANDRNWRDTYGVDASEAYDGKAGTTYDLRFMVHAIHAAGEGAPYVIYRGTNGIYAFGSRESIDALPNWPGSGSQTVYGSSPATSRNHNEIVVHYPRGLSECGACHVDDAVSLPSTFDAVAVTVDAGGTSYGVQTDDVLVSPATASCMSCHGSTDNATQAALRAHAYQNSWMPAAFTNGRADVLGGGAFESCLVCHGAGKVADFNAAHGN